jgi:hypothetical protein
VSGDAFINFVKCQMKEVFEDNFTVMHIKFFDVLDLAYVYHADILDKQYLNCAWMVRFFFTRYHFQGNSFSALHFCLHSPFSNVYTERYTLRMWYFRKEGAAAFTC